MPPTYCEPCKDSGKATPTPATKLMPQSSDQGKTVTYMAVCDGHAEGWWDGADWDGKHLEKVIK